MRELLGRMILGSADCQPAVVGGLLTTKMMAAEYYVNDIAFGRLPKAAGKLPALPAIERMSI